MDKLAALHCIFSHLGMLAGSTLSHVASLKAENEGGFPGAKDMDDETGDDEEKDEDGPTAGSPSGALSDVKFAARCCMSSKYSQSSAG